MGGKRNLVLGRCAAVLFLCGAVASLPANLILGAGRDAYLLDALALASAVVCWLVPWDRIDWRWLHVLVVVATAEVTIAVVAHGRHAMVFTWYFVLVAVFAAYAFRRRPEAIGHVGLTLAGMVGTAVHASGTEPDALANATVGVPTVAVAAAVVVWLREGLERRERTDPLTGLGNRRALMEALDETADRRLVRLLVMFDLDGFKDYNDRLGHSAGDRLLERLGAALAAAVGESGEAFRLGGDELCVLLAETEALSDCTVALNADGVTASHGTAWIPHEAETPSDALRLADDRMYAAKRTAKDAPFLTSASPSGTQTAPESLLERHRHPERSPSSAR